MIPDLATLQRIAAAAAPESVSAQPQVLSDRVDGHVVRFGGVVVKVHDADAELRALRKRLDIAAQSNVLLAPISWSEICGRIVSVWPYGEPVDRDDPDVAPWKQAASVLARLHNIPVAMSAPPAGAPGRVTRALSRLGDHPAGDIVRQAAESLREPENQRRCLTHGDWHLGQLVHYGQQWRLIDVDDLGIGDPAWDLARPAAWYASGLLPAEHWEGFLASYRAESGPAIPATGDPWPQLDYPARALTVQSAALAISSAVRDERELDDIESALIDTCARIAGSAGPPGVG